MSPLLLSSNFRAFPPFESLSICLLNVFSVYFTVPADRPAAQRSTRTAHVAPFLGRAAGTRRSTPRVLAGLGRVISTDSVVFERRQGEDRMNNVL